MGTEIILNKQQNEAKDKILNWFQNETNKKQYFILGGYAGTGKTFLVNYIINSILELKNVAFIAPTGKAASVLAQRGAFNATTIHRLIYNRIETEYTSKVDGKVIKSKKVEFLKKPSISNYELIVLDETSMVSSEIMEDLLSFGRPVLCCGDPGQLPPCSGKSNGLLDNPDYTLTEIVRQESENSIVKLATKARAGLPIQYGDYGNVLVLNSENLSSGELSRLLIKADQVLCGTNQTRVAINNFIKQHMGLKIGKINNGEKVICLLNNWSLTLDEDENFFLVNGIIGSANNVLEINHEDNLTQITFTPDFSYLGTNNIIIDDSIFKNGEFTHKFHDKVYELENGNYQVKKILLPKKCYKNNDEYNKALKEYLIQKRDAVAEEQLNFFDSAYCISVHKAQGAEWDKVVVFDQSYIFGKDASKWLYTAITRAKKKLVIIK